jgi:hypothetical protein
VGAADEDGDALDEALAAADGEANTALDVMPGTVAPNELLDAFTGATGATEPALENGTARVVPGPPPTELAEALTLARAPGACPAAVATALADADAIGVWGDVCPLPSPLQAPEATITQLHEAAISSQDEWRRANVLLYKTIGTRVAQPNSTAMFTD